VKLYTLTDQGTWEDRGTGQITCAYSSELDGLAFCLRSEEDQSVLLEHRIVQGNDYSHQNETIITWQDPDNEGDYALSFQEQAGCRDMWVQICHVQGRDPDAACSPPGDGEHPDGSDGDGHSRVLEVPAAVAENLEQVLRAIADCPDGQRAALTVRLTSGGFVRELLELFQTREYMDSTADLEQLHRIFKEIILHASTVLLGTDNDSGRIIFDLLLGDECIAGLMGVMEYEPGLPESQKVSHRQNVVGLFKEVVAIRNPELKAKIHQTFRIAYLRDVVIPRTIEDSTFGALKQMEIFNKIDIVAALQDDTQFVGELFGTLRGSGPEPDAEVVLNAAKLLHELCTYATNLTDDNRMHFNEKMAGGGLYEVIGGLLVRSRAAAAKPLRQVCVAVLLTCVHHSPGQLRAFLMQQTPQMPLFKVMVHDVLHDEELQGQLAELLRLLIDPETMQNVDRDTFLEQFYEHYMTVLVAALTDDAAGEVPAQQAAQQAQARTHVCDLLSFCIQHHQFRIRYYILKNTVIQKVLALLRQKDKSLKLAAIRVLRACVGTQDEFYNRYLVKHDLFQPVVAALVENGARYNLLNSALLDLFEFIWKQNIKSLIAHLATTFQEFFEAIEYTGTFRSLLKKNEQYQDAAGQGSGMGPASAVSAAPGGVGGLIGSERIDDDEAYFNESDDEEPAVAESPLDAIGLLAAYGDGDDSPAPNVESRPDVEAAAEAAAAPSAEDEGEAEGESKRQRTGDTYTT